MGKLAGEIQVQGAAHRALLRIGWTGRIAIWLDGKPVQTSGRRSFLVAGVPASLRIEEVGPFGRAFAVQIEGRDYPLHPVTDAGSPIPEAEVRRKHLRSSGLGFLLAGAIALAIGIQGLSAGERGIKVVIVGGLMLFLGAFGLVESRRARPNLDFGSPQFVGPIPLPGGVRRIDIRLLSDSKCRVLLDDQTVAEQKTFRRLERVTFRAGTPPLTVEVDCRSPPEHGWQAIDVVCGRERVVVPRLT